VSIEILPLDQCATRGDGRVTYEEFGGKVHTPPAPPCFIFGTLPGYLAPDLYGEAKIGGVGCYRLRDAQVVFDGIMLAQGAALWSLALNHPRPHVHAVMSAQARGWADLPVRRVVGQAAIIHGPGFDIFGHWLVDFLPRLYGLTCAGHNIETMTFILPSSTPLFARTYLRAIGVKDENIVWHDQLGERIAADELVVPTLFRLRNRFHPAFVPATRFWSDRLGSIEACTPAGGDQRRIFVSRSRLGGARQLRLRGAIETCAAAAGYEVVFPETMSVEQQIRLFRSARHIVGEYGSGMHGSIFARPGSVICALRGTSHHPGFAQSGLAERFGQKIGYVFGETPEHAGDHPFEIEIDAFKSALSATQAWASVNSSDI
jgi:capsular polysaccharide biosynthesis protein